MKIVLVGCGKVGSAILENLEEENHDIVAIDIKPEIAEEIGEDYDVIGICGSGTHYDILKEAGTADCDLFIAITDSDEINMLSCFIARQMGASHTAARIRTHKYSSDSLSFLKSQLELDLVVNPELLCSDAIYSLIELPSVSEAHAFAKSNFETVEFIVKEGSKLAGMPLYSLRTKSNTPFLVCAVRRGNEAIIPHGDFVIEENDSVVITAAKGDMKDILRSFGLEKRRARKIMIVGASRIAQYLAERLLKSGYTVKIIDFNKERCEEISEYLPDRAQVIYGDGTKHQLLIEEGIEKSDVFTTLTGLDEDNILISYFASDIKVPKVITKINRSTYLPISRKLGLDTLVSPKDITADVVTQYTRSLMNAESGRIETMYSLFDGQIETLMFLATEKFSHMGISLMDLKLKPGVLIAGITRGNTDIVPGGSDAIEAGDRVIVFALDVKLNELNDILA